MLPALRGIDPSPHAAGQAGALDVVLRPFRRRRVAGLDRAIGKTHPDFAEYLMADDYGDRFPEYPIQHGVPGGLPMINFPEISMYNMFPWGGYGANPLPRHIQRIWDSAGAHLAGGFPYSEGIFEDLNKAVCFQHYWSGRDAIDTVREYLAYEGSPDAVDEAAKAVEIMEAQHDRSSQTVEGRGQELHTKLFPAGGRMAVPMFNLPDLSRAGECLNLIRAAESKLTPASPSKLALADPRHSRRARRPFPPAWRQARRRHRAALRRTGRHLSRPLGRVRRLPAEPKSPLAAPGLTQPVIHAAIKRRAPRGRLFCSQRGSTFSGSCVLQVRHLLAQATFNTCHPLPPSLWGHAPRGPPGSAQPSQPRLELSSPRRRQAPKP